MVPEVSIIRENAGIISKRLCISVKLCAFANLTCCKRFPWNIVVGNSPLLVSCFKYLCIEINCRDEGTSLNGWNLIFQ